MKRFFLLLSFTIIFLNVKSQCFEIQSILVDACAGSQEGQNEMVIFQVGSSPMLTTNLTVNWPNNSWLGLTKNASTAADISMVNATIVGCGLLKEPTSNVLPANSKVLLVTSTAWSPLAQSFVNLNDTLYVIFQTAGNTSGHFANYAAGGGLRTLSMSFSTPIGCSDVVTYDRALLINQAGNIGGQDGGAVEFSVSGIPSYINNGCQAPYIPLSLDAGNNATLCAGASQNFSATTSGVFNSVNWSLGTGASGSFTPSNALNTTYTSGLGETGTIKLFCTIFKACGTQTTSVKDSVLLTITPLPTVTINPSNITICSGQSAITAAMANTAVTYTWSTAANTNSVSLNSAGVYTCNVSNACGSASSSVSVTLSASPTLSIASTSPSICTNGQTVTLTTSGSTGTFLWSNGSINASTSISAPGVYTATVTTFGCGSAVSSITIAAISSPIVSLSASPSIICSGQSSTLTATSNESNFSWSNGGSTNQQIINTPGVITVSVSNTCGIATSSTMISSSSFPVLNLNSSSSTICPNETATLTVSGGTAPYAWSNSSNTSSMVTTNGGIITVSNTNACGTATASIAVTVTNLNASISANPINGLTPLVVDFTNNSSGATTFLWDFGNGNSAVTQTVSSQTYTTVGSYVVYLFVTSGACLDIDSLTINVFEEGPTLYVPNAFTPNGDSINDVFFASGTNIKEFNIIIFDRWGLKLFEASDIKTGWDGKSNGKEVSDGTYFHLINAIGNDNKEIRKQGTITLFK
jgi:gliding motility-associated-like protein